VTNDLPRFDLWIICEYLRDVTIKAFARLTLGGGCGCEQVAQAVLQIALSFGRIRFKLADDKLSDVALQSPRLSLSLRDILVPQC
jgi:hypothetical protein